MSVEQTKPDTVTVEQADAFIAENYVAGRSRLWQDDYWIDKRLY
jgi:hypothetical protein